MVCQYAISLSLPRVVWSVVLAGLLHSLCAGGALGQTPAVHAKPAEGAIRALLNRCVGCHSGETAKGSLDLTGRDAALKGGVSGVALVPGKPDQSPLYQRVAARQMPPNQPLSPTEIALLRRWIADGAAWPTLAAPTSGSAPDWWALRPIKRPTPPKVKAQTQVRNPIDAFLLAELEKRGLSFAPPADRLTLIRRATFDLLGVPPTRQECDSFVMDRSPNAYEKLLDRLLADPRYGERWGRHWLDVARFGESQGFERDKIRDHAWRYRDYVIQAFNQDKPYARFIQEQIAGDVLEPVTTEGIIATGFLVAAPWDEAGQTQQSAINRMRVREEEMEELVGTVGQTFLGMTVNCARCHDHKFDPISMRDYYRLRAALDGVRHGDRSIYPADEKRQREIQAARIRAQIAAAEQARYALERKSRLSLLASARGDRARFLPRPLALWTFETDGRDELGGMHATLENGATLARGRLKLNGAGAYAVAQAFPNALREKTLEAWVTLANLSQRGAGVLSVQSADKKQFDAIVFAEREPGKWIAGSDFFRRTRDLPAPVETAHPDELIHLAIVYDADQRVTVYRNGVPYGETYPLAGGEGTLAIYPAHGAQVLFGLRHTDAGNGFLAGEIEEARLYDRALRPEEIQASCLTGPGAISEEAAQARLTPEERTRCEVLRKEASQGHDALRALRLDALTYAASPTQPEAARILLRGDVESPGEVVAPGGLACVGRPTSDFGLPPDAPDAERRRRLAAWIAHPDNPLTWRVIVNRVWHYHFGRGLVASPNDFGLNGERPTHPELLDWLAASFVGEDEQRSVSSGPKIQNLKTHSPISLSGSLKALHRLIMLSSAYRQSGRFNPKAAALDAENRYLWRFAPRRLEGEAIRDAMLCVSGQINYARGGPGFRPFMVTINNSHFYTLTDTESPEFNRRAVYRISVHSAKSPFLETLDCPDPSTKTPRRAVTTTPLQALELMNSAFTLRQARHFAARLRREAGRDPQAQALLAYRLAFGRAPTSAEREEAATLIRANGLETLCWALFNASEFLYMP